MSRRVRCKFFARGACLKGECCEFSHDWKAPPNNICTYYQKGACAYGSRCRFNHMIIPHTESCALFSSSFHGPPVSGIASTATTQALTNGTRRAHCSPSEIFCTNKTFSPSAKQAWNQQSERFEVEDDSDAVDSTFVRPVDRTLCPFAAVGSCPLGEKCPHIHGDLCSTCGKNCLHPFRLEECQEHKRSCERRQKHLDSLKDSQDIECSVCLERVLSKPTSAERKFGLLSECDHPFCISCIRNWRSNSPSSGMDINSALRACPICRKLSYFVVPSVIWYFSKAEKQEIIYNYKSKLKSIDCKYFDFGSGLCPFGDSCFYKHAYHDGSLEEEDPNHVGVADGNPVIDKERLPGFLSGLHIR